jgi:Spy/CpxP family protein refolding chaperone
MISTVMSVRSYQREMNLDLSLGRPWVSLRKLVNNEGCIGVSPIDRTRRERGKTSEVDMKTRNIILAIVAAALIAVPGSAVAQSGPGGGGYGPHGGHHGGFAGGDGGGILQFLEHALPRLAERLELSDEQVAQIQAILDEEGPVIQDHLEELRSGREEWREDNDPAVFDEGAVRAFAESQGSIHVKLMVAADRAKALVFQVLTPEQREQLEEMRNNRDKHFMRRSGGRRR